jgi:hypothetical protein
MKKKILLFLSVVSILFASCEDFLDKEPDNRVNWNTSEQLSKLMVDAYMTGNYAVLGELSSDNYIDNNAPNDQGQILYNLAPFERMHNEIFAFEDVVSGDQQDSPSDIWSSAYRAIAVANHALEAIDNMVAEASVKEKDAVREDLGPQRGEALVVRAYHHFILVNIFAQAFKSDELSRNDKGVPYVTEPEKTVSVHYERLSVSEVYRLIEKDLLAGINLLDDNYKQVKYRFNKRAANAFAARFYLYKRQWDKVIQYADLAIGATPEESAKYMRNWNGEWPTFERIVHAYTDAQSANNFMLLATASWFQRLNSAPRYSHNGAARVAIFDSGGPNWSGRPKCYDGRMFIGGDVQEHGLFFPKCGELFEFTDKVAQIGFGHVVRCEFTGEETLLCRAEAYIYKNDIPRAIKDLEVWVKSRNMEGNEVAELTEAKIRNFYKDTVISTRKGIVFHDFHTTDMSPDFIVTANQKPIVDCLLHFRRIETHDEGLRWFDIKRYGIEIIHKIGKERVETLKWDDLRRAIQIPQEVIAAGMEPNIRLAKPDSPPAMAKVN